MYKQTLVIIDIQPGFSESLFVLDRVLQEIKQAKRKGWPIIIIEYKGAGSFDCIHNAIRNYKRSTVLEKSIDDGSSWIEDWVKSHKQYDTGVWRIMGVSTECCVLATVEGLQFLFPDYKFILVKDACASHGSQGYFHSYAIKHMYSNGVKII